MSEKAKPYNPEEIETGLKKLGVEWMAEGDKILSKVFEFKSFMEAIDFVNKVAEIAEKEEHHPDIHLFEYKKVNVELTTRDIGGISKKDFDMAEKIEESAK